MNLIRPKLSKLFYPSGPQQTIPECPIMVAPWYHSEAVFHSYTESKDISCAANPSLQLLPFFVDNYGPRYTEWTTTAHEQLPGHHLEVRNVITLLIISFIHSFVRSLITFRWRANFPPLYIAQVRSYIEKFRSKCNDIISWLSRPNYFPGFTEGWATYVEYPLLANDTDIYSNASDKNVLLQKYGMIKYQVMIITRVTVQRLLTFGYVSLCFPKGLILRTDWTELLIGRPLNCLRNLDFSSVKWHLQLWQHGKIIAIYFWKDLNMVLRRIEGSLNSDDDDDGNERARHKSIGFN